VDDVLRLHDALVLQRDKYAEVAAMSERQRALLESGDLEGLMSLIEAKRARLEEVESVKRGVADAMQRWPQLRSSCPPEVARRVEAVVEEIRAILEKILRVEEEDRGRFERGRDERAAEIRDLRQRQKLRDAYGQKEQGGAGFVDDKK